MASAAALWLVLLTALAALQDDPPRPLPGERRHQLCNTTGRLPFELSRRWEVEQDRGDSWKVLFCSEAITSDNMALDWQPCSSCRTPSLKAAAVEQHEAIRARNEAWLEERREVNRIAGVEKLVHIETTHIVLSWDIPRIKVVDKKTYRMHEAAHLYARRLEQAYAEFQARFGVSDRSNMRNKHYFMFFEREAPLRKAGPPFTGLQGGNTLKRAGGLNHKSTVVGFWDRGSQPSEADLHRHFVHTLIHQLTSVYYDVHWFRPGEKGLMPPWLLDKYGWLDAGLAHWFERRLPGKSTTYCMREQDLTARWKGHDWRKNVWKAVMAGETPSMTEVFTRSTHALTPREHQFCWSWVDFLLNRNEAGMGKALRLTKQQVPTRDILKQVWGLSFIGFEQAWLEWVRVEYAPTKKRR